MVKSHLGIPYVCAVKGSPVHRTSLSLRVISVYVMYVSLGGSPVHRTSLSLRDISVHLMYVSLRGQLYTLHLCG